MKPRVIFLHAMKTGGTSVRHMLLKEYGYDAIAPVPMGGSKKDVPYPVLLDLNPLWVQDHIHEVELDKLKRFSVMMSHYDWGIVDRLPRWDVIALLRDPVHQIQSLYRYMQQSPDFPDFRQRDFMKWVQGSGRVYLNHQTKVLSSHGRGYSLDRALQNLEDSRLCFGILEAFEESVERWNRRFGWSMQVQHENRSWEKTVLDPVAYQIVRRLQSDDMMLYGRARELFGEIV